MNTAELDQIINNNLETSKSDTDVFNLSEYNLILFTDGAYERVKKRSSFGIYITSKNKNSKYYKYNDTKTIKKLDKEIFIYHLYNKDIAFHSTFYNNNINYKCKEMNCKYIAVFGDLINNGFCKAHKTDSMKLNYTYYTYDSTNIRSEGFAILYSLIFIKLICIDNKSEKKDIINDLNNINKQHILNYNVIDHSKDHNKTNFLLVTDSEFWINVITKWCNNWINKELTLDKKNCDLIFYINYYLNLLQSNNISIHFKFVKGHADKNTTDLNFYQKGNVIADKLANIAKESTSYQVQVSANF
jgi:ribonuclease HI